MSNQKFSAIEREAIWISHQKKCVYTRELIDVANFHIDHVLPENLLSRPEEFTKAKTKFGLSNDFDLLGFGNVLPCKAEINLQKSSNLFSENAIHFYLELASKKKKEIELNISKIEKRINQGKAIILLQQLVESGRLTKVEFAQALEKCSQAPDESFNLLCQMEFSEKSNVRVVYKSDIDQLMDMPVKFGRNDHINSIPMINEHDEKYEVSTCNQYLNAIKDGYYVAGGVFIKIASWLEHYTGLLLSLKSATLPDISYISSPKVGVSDLQLIPATIFPFMEEPDVPLTGKTYQDLIDEGILTVKRVSSNLLEVETDTMGQTLIEAVRADFNNDGAEDILLFEYCYATKGTLGYGNVIILTRNTPSSLFELVTLESFRSQQKTNSLEMDTITASNILAGHSEIGTIIESINLTGYTYINVITDDGENVWLATIEAIVSIGDKIEYPETPPLLNFASNSLNRTFHKILFVPSIRIIATAEEEL